MRPILLASAALIIAGCNSQPPELNSETTEADAAQPGAAAPAAAPAEDSGDMGADSDPALPDDDDAAVDADGAESDKQAQIDALAVSPEPAPVVEVSDTAAEESRAANGDQTPQSPDQTRAPKPPVTHAWKIEPVTDALGSPWAIEFLPSGAMLVSEKAGNLRIVGRTHEVSVPLKGLPEVDTRNQGGLLDIALSPDFRTDRMVYFTFSEPREDGKNGTSLGRGTLAKGGLENVEVIFRQTPSAESTGHFGSRIAFAPDGTLFAGLGERMVTPFRDQAQNPENHLGAVVHLNPDGTPADGNPFLNGGGAPEVWSYGHRNIQAAAIQPETGDLWTIEHGPKGGDEVNRPQPGKNYGWPVIVYGEDYDDTPIGDGIAVKEGMEQPVYYWDPVIAPSGMDFYEGDLFPEWQGDIFVGGLATKRVSRLTVEGGRVTGEEWLAMPGRVRDVKTGPDGAIYLALEDAPNQIVRIVPDLGE